MIVDMLGRGHDVCGLMVVDYIMVLDMTDSFEHATRQRFLGVSLRDQNLLTDMN